MGEPPPFTGAVREIVAGLRDARPTHGVLNGASSGIDQVGRRLHGLGYVRSGEIADCFMAALADLDQAHGLAEEARGEAVKRVIARMEDALEHAAAGVLPFAT
jgi:hypothetical protein